jgi:hypothetical protein
MNENQAPWESNYNIHLKKWEPGWFSPTLSFKKN